MEGSPPHPKWDRKEDLMDRLDALARGGGPAGPAGKVEEGIQASDEALRLDPRNADLWAFKAIALSGGLGRHEEALQCGEMAMQLDPDIAEAVMPPEELRKAPEGVVCAHGRAAHEAAEEKTKVPGAPPPADKGKGDQG